MPLNGRRRKKVPLSAEGPRREEEEEKKNEKIRRKELHLKTGRMNRAAIYEIGQAARAVGLAVRAFFLSFFLQRPRVASQRPASKQASKQAGGQASIQRDKVLDKARANRANHAIRKPSISILSARLVVTLRSRDETRATGTITPIGAVHKNA